MNDPIIKKILEATGPFSTAHIMRAVRLVEFFSGQGITIDDLTVFRDAVLKAQLEIERQRNMNKKRFDRWSKSAKRCPDCGSPMTLEPVNTGPRDQTGDDSRSVYRCINNPRLCGNMIYNTMTVNQIDKRRKNATIPRR